MEYDETTRTLTAGAGKVIVRKEDGTGYGRSVRLGYCHVIGGRVLAEPHADTPDDFEERDAETGSPSPALTAKERKKAEIEAYDSSEAVNSFTVNGQKAWLTNAERTSYTASVGNAELLGETTIDLLLNGQVLTLPIGKAKVMLAQISRYADKCWMVTQRHLMAVDALESDAEIEAYDYRAGYPERLGFEVAAASDGAQDDAATGSGTATEGGDA